MPPLIGVALTLLPDLAKCLTRDARPETRDIIVGVVREILGTDDPEEAARRVADQATAATLRIRLAEIAAEIEAQRLAAQTEALKIELGRGQAYLQDGQDARSMLETLAGTGSPFAWGSVVVSIVVTAGFFATLLYLIRGGFDPLAFDPANPATQLVFQIVNIAVGALTAGFATVVSFWLGSSDGSRRKDLTALQMQSAASATNRQHAQTTRDLIEARVDPARQAQPFLGALLRGARGAGAGAQKSSRQFHDCVAVIFHHEGGYVDHPDDPGGATNLGITHTTLAAWRGRAVSRADVRALDLDEAREIYRANYWNALSCDQLPAGVDLVAFDFGVNAGVRRAAKMLQTVLGVAADGQIGPITVAAAERADARHVVEAFSDARLSYYRGLRHWRTFGRGWSRRTNETRDRALEMLA